MEPLTGGTVLDDEILVMNYGEFRNPALSGRQYVLTVSRKRTGRPLAGPRLAIANQAWAGSGLAAVYRTPRVLAISQTLLCRQAALAVSSGNASMRQASNLRCASSVSQLQFCRCARRGQYSRYADAAHLGGKIYLLIGCAAKYPLPTASRSELWRRTNCGQEQILGIAGWRRCGCSGINLAF